MLSFNKPYFMTDDSWYYYDRASFKYKLTDKAPKEAIDSYKEYYEEYKETIIDAK